MCYPDISGLGILPTVLLGLITAFKEDLQASPSDLLYGGSLRLLTDFFYEAYNPVDSSEFFQNFREYFNILRPTPTAHHNKGKLCIFKNSVIAFTSFYVLMLFENFYRHPIQDRTR